MSQVYLYSDPHFGHEAIAKKRGFVNAKEQDEFIVRRWNSTVNKNDKIYILGDITMETANYNILKRLKGQITVVGGNHDKPGHTKELLKYVSAFAGAISYKHFLLTHIPVNECELIGAKFGKFRGNIHGHVHENELDDDRYFCVSAECIDFTPIKFTTILEYFDKL